MFDEYVEHAPGLESSHTAPRRPLPEVHYQGFEPDPDTFNPEYAPEIDTTSATSPVFELVPVQYNVPAPLISLAVSSDVLAMALHPADIVLIELTHADLITRISIPRNDLVIHKLFLDPSGRHLIITSTQGENWYLFRGWKKPRQLKSFNRIVIESVAWNKPALLTSHGTSTREFLIGARSGTIYEAVVDAEEDFFKSPDRALHSVYTFPERQPIIGLEFNFFPPRDPNKVLVIATTASRIYQFVGAPDRRSDDGRSFSKLFASYRDTTPKMSELPGNIQRSELQFFTPSAEQAQSLPRNLAWLTGHGVYHGVLNFESTTDDLIDNVSLLPYPATDPSAPQAPISLALTEFHFLLLFNERIVGLSALDEKLAYEERLKLSAQETVRGLAADPVRKTYWLYTDQMLYELVVTSEDRNVWKIYLEQDKFDVALRYAKSAPQRDHVLAAQAKAHFAEGRFFEAAKCYGQCSAPFEEVALKFLDANERDALRLYLISRLERTKKSDVTQRLILATWLVEIYLSKCNELDDLIASESASHGVDDLRVERTLLEEDLRSFFGTYKHDLDQKTTYELIQAHGRTDMYIHYATVVEDFDRVIEHWIMEEQWTRAIDVINRQNDLEMYYRFAPVLMRQAPKDAVDSWLRQPSMDPIRLIPAILQLQHVPPDVLTPNQAIRYLNHVIFEQGITSSTIHNLLLTFLASPRASSSTQSEDDTMLLRFLSTAPSDPITGKPYYDLDYALRLCKQSGRIQPCVHIYAKMGLYENSVDLALEKGDLELAKVNADRPEDDLQLRKKLWLKIAKYVVQDKKDIKSAMRFLENTDLLKIEDILPFFPDFVVIDDFKEEIAHALEEYAAQIDVLKNDMDEATRTAETIKQDITALKDRFVTIDAGELCAVCSHLLLSRQFYVFPCHHTFHADCLISLAKEYLPSHVLRRILVLQAELTKGTAQPALNAANITSSPPIAPSSPPSKQNGTQRSLLSANFNPIQDGAKVANTFGRGLLTAGDKLRDLIIPDALASVVSAPNWIPGIGGTPKRTTQKDGGKRMEKLRAELDEVLASSCPLCESVVAGLDKPFVQDDKVDDSWAL